MVWLDEQRINTKRRKRKPAGERTETGIAGYFGVASIKFWLGLRDKRTSPINRTSNLYIRSHPCLDCPRSGPGQVRGKFSGPEPGPLGSVHNNYRPGPGPQRTRARGSGSGPVRARSWPSSLFFSIHVKSYYNESHQEKPNLLIQKYQRK